METDKVKNIVEGTFTKTDLSVVVQQKIGIGMISFKLH